MTCKPGNAFPRDQRAISIASNNNVVRMFDGPHQPTILRLNASVMKQTYATAAQVGDSPGVAAHPVHVSRPG